MRTIGRRELNHNLSRILDEVERTGESVTVLSRGAGGVVIKPRRDESPDPLEGRTVRRAKHELEASQLPARAYAGDARDLIDWVRGDR